jgi:hypothetical protein
MVRPVRAAILLLGVLAVLFAGPGLARADSPKDGHSSDGRGEVAHGSQGNGKPTTTPTRTPGAPAGSVHGIVQSVGAGVVVVTQIDGSTVGVPVASSTRVFVDGQRVSLTGVQPGFVASASWKAGKAAGELFVFDPSAAVAVVRSVSPRGVVVSDAAGNTVTVPVTAKTRVLVDGTPASVRSVAVGDTLVLETPGRGRPAAELRFLRPG